MHRQRSRFATLLIPPLALLLSACGSLTVSPSSYAGSPDSPDLVLRVEAEEGDQIVEAKAIETDADVVVVEVRLEEGDGGQAAKRTATIEPLEANAPLEATVRLAQPLGGRQVVDQEGRAIPQA